MEHPQYQSNDCPQYEATEPGTLCWWDIMSDTYWQFPMPQKQPNEPDSLCFTDTPSVTADIAASKPSFDATVTPVNPAPAESAPQPKPTADVGEPAPKDPPTVHHGLETAEKAPRSARDAGEGAHVTDAGIVDVNGKFTYNTKDWHVVECSIENGIVKNARGTVVGQIVLSGDELCMRDAAGRVKHFSSWKGAELDLNWTDQEGNSRAQKFQLDNGKLAQSGDEITLSTDTPLPASDKTEAQMLQSKQSYNMEVNANDLVDALTEKRITERQFIEQANARFIQQNFHLTPQQYQKFVQEKPEFQYDTTDGKNRMDDKQAIEAALQGYGQYTLNVPAETYAEIVQWRNDQRSLSEVATDKAEAVLAATVAGTAPQFAETAQAASNVYNYATGEELTESETARSLRHTAEVAKAQAQQELGEPAAGVIQGASSAALAVSEYEILASTPAGAAGAIGGLSLQSGLAHAHEGSKAAVGSAFMTGVQMTAFSAIPAIPTAAGRFATGFGVTAATSYATQGDPYVALGEGLVMHGVGEAKFRFGEAQAAQERATQERTNPERAPKEAPAQARPTLEESQPLFQQRALQPLFAEPLAWAERPATSEAQKPESQPRPAIQASEAAGRTAALGPEGGAYTAGGEGSTARETMLYQPLPGRDACADPEAVRQSNRYKDGGEMREKIVDGFQTLGGDERIQTDGTWVDGYRPSVVVDPAQDPVLQQTLNEAARRFGSIRDERELATALAQYSKEVMTPPGMSETELTERYTDSFRIRHAGDRVLLGEYIQQAADGTGGGICQHQALLFKTLADRMGLDATLVHGVFGTAPADRSTGTNHAWNQVNIDGQTFGVDPRQRVYVEPLESSDLQFHNPFRDVPGPDNSRQLKYALAGVKEGDTISYQGTPGWKVSAETSSEPGNIVLRNNGSRQISESEFRALNPGVREPVQGQTYRMSRSSGQEELGWTYERTIGGKLKFVKEDSIRVEVPADQLGVQLGRRRAPLLTPTPEREPVAPAKSETPKPETPQPENPQPPREVVPYERIAEGRPGDRIQYGNEQMDFIQFDTRTGKPILFKGGRGNNFCRVGEKVTADQLNLGFEEVSLNDGKRVLMNKAHTRVYEKTTATPDGDFLLYQDPQYVIAAARESAPAQQPPLDFTPFPAPVERPVQPEVADPSLVPFERGQARTGAEVVFNGETFNIARFDIATGKPILYKENRGEGFVQQMRRATAEELTSTYDAIVLNDKTFYMNKAHSEVFAAMPTGDGTYIMAQEHQYVIFDEAAHPEALKMRRSQ